MIFFAFQNIKKQANL